jgi:drug/metabolite transporter (DMT)-like permease
MNLLSKRARADLALGFCSLIWGATFVVVKDALADCSVFLYIAIRFSLAAVLMGLLFWRSLRELNRKTIWAGVQIGLFMFGGYAFQTSGLNLTSPSNAAFITGSSVILVPILLAAFGRRHMTTWIWAGAVAALAGLYLLTVPPEGLSHLNRGDPLVFMCAVMFAFHMIFIGRHVERHSVGALSFLQVATTAILAWASVPLIGAAGWERPRLHWSGQLIFAIAITAIGSTVIGFSFQTWAQQYASPAHTAILVSLEPVFAVATAYFFAQQRLGARALAGAALVLAGILLAELRSPAPVAPESPEPIVTRLD